MNHFLPQKRKLAAIVAASLIGASFAAHSEERADLENMRATTLGLIDALVDSGVLSRQKADKLIGDAEAKAKARMAAAPAAAAEAPELGKDGKKIVRVSYVPETLKREMREQIKQDVLAQAKTERWGEPGALPGWLDRIQFEGDVRLRYEMNRLDPDNTPAGFDYSESGSITRAADIAGDPNLTAPSFNTQENTNRMRLRARLGANAKVSDMISAGISFSTGNTTNRVSTNQTLGQNFNKYSVVLDRGYLKFDPASWLSITGGRIRNPFFSTDLVWADDLNFEGAAVTVKPRLSSTAEAFVTAGYFPLREDNPGRGASRELIGVQAGLDMQFGKARNKLKFGAAVYDFRGIEGVAETDERYGFGLGVSDYIVRSEYAEGFRQRGNSLFFINAPSDFSSAVKWGLASKFRELNITASLDLAQFDPLHIILTGDFVKNLAFDRDEIARRIGFRIEDGKSHGYMGKIQVGNPAIAKRGDWNTSLAYRYLGSDAVLDAFTNSDFGLGGTNNKGTILGLNYGIDKNAWVSARWLSSDLIDPMVPRISGSNPSTKLSVDTVQLDFNARF